MTYPAEEDLRSPELGPLVRRYLGGKLGVDVEARLRALNLAADLTASDFGATRRCSPSTPRARSRPRS